MSLMHRSIVSNVLATASPSAQASIGQAIDQLAVSLGGALSTLPWAKIAMIVMTCALAGFSPPAIAAAVEQILALIVTPATS